MGNGQSNNGDEGARAAPSKPAGGAGAGGRLNSAINKNKKTASNLEKRMNMLEKKIENEVKQARAKIKAGRKHQALIHMKRKKMYEKHVESLRNQITNLETQAFALENTSAQQQVLDATRTATAQLQHANRNMDIDTVQDITDNLADAMQDQNEVNELLGQTMDVPGLDLDDDTMMGELDELMAEDDEKEVQATMNALPSVPTNLVKPNQQSATAVEENEEESLAELEAMMT